jgi:hypothetical protein
VREQEENLNAKKRKFKNEINLNQQINELRRDDTLDASANGLLAQKADTKAASLK